jgi:outer membrane protein assembly factor BamD
MKLLFLSVLFMSLILTGCAGSKTLQESSIQEIFKNGLDNLEEEKYLQAQSDFTQVLIRGSGSDLGDDAQYYFGEAYYRNEEYMSAIVEYEKLTRRMGFSPYVEDARFKICESYKIESPKYFHDQEYTEKALERYQEFLDDYPDSEYFDEVLFSIESLRDKMGLKLYETGILYMKMEEYYSARMTFNKVIDLYYDTPIVYEAKAGVVEAFAYNKEIDEAYKSINSFETDLKANNLYDDAMETILKIEKMVSQRK